MNLAIVEVARNIKNVAGKTRNDKERGHSP